MRYVSGLTAIGLLALSSVASGAQIAGRVEILDKGDVKRQTIRDTVVYVEGLKAAIPRALFQKSYTITSQDKVFTPRVQAVPVGARVTFPNMDSIMHNVFSLSRGNRFDLGHYKSGAEKTHRFDSPGLVRVYCNIHPQMSAFLLVMENPYYTFTKPDGSFRIDGVPPGTYTVRAWNEQADTTRELTVTEAGAEGVAFVLDARRFKDKPHLNKHGRRYKKRRY
jgi:plastocyanin